MKAGFGIREEFCKDFDGIYSEVPIKHQRFSLEEGSPKIEGEGKMNDNENFVEEKCGSNPDGFLFAVPPKQTYTQYSYGGSNSISLNSISNIVESFKSDLLENIDRMAQKVRLYVQDAHSRRQAYEQILSLLEITTSNIRHIVFTSESSPTIRHLNKFEDDIIAEHEDCEGLINEWANQNGQDGFIDWPIKSFLESNEKQETEKISGVNVGSLSYNYEEMAEGDIHGSLIMEDVMERTKKLQLSSVKSIPNKPENGKGSNSDCMLSGKIAMEPNAARLLFGNILPNVGNDGAQMSSSPNRSRGSSLGLFIRNGRETSSPLSVKSEGESLFLRNGDKLESDPNLAEWIIASDNN